MNEKNFLQKVRKMLPALLSFLLLPFLGWAAGVSEYCEYLMGTNTAQYAYITFETNAEGNIVLTIAPYAGDTDTRFRNNGFADDVVRAMTVNDDPNTDNKYFTRTISEDKLQLTLIPVAGMMTVGDILDIDGIMEYRTSHNDNLWPTYQFTYTYGTDCGDVPVVTLTPETISFTPDDGVQTFTVYAENLTGDLNITGPRGLTISPAVLSPDNEGKINNEPVSVIWNEGASGTPLITISGGGLVTPKVVMASSTGFSEYCNRVITQNDGGVLNPAYMTVSLSDDKKVLIFSIAPYNDDETATWNSNSIPAEKILVNGVVPLPAPERERVDENTKIVITLDQALSDGDEVTFGAPLVWTVKNNTTGDEANNVFIDPAMVYTVGYGCELNNSASHGVRFVGNAHNISHSSADVEIILHGTAVKVHFEEESAQIANIVLDKTANNIYTLEGLTEQTTYSFIVTALDDTDTHSDPHPTKLTFTTAVPTSLEVVEQGILKVYPSPAKEVLYIDGIEGGAEVEIKDIQGRLIDRQVTAGEVNVGGLAGGVYILFVEGNAVKFIKE